jgi:hypothetical protein
MAELTLEMAEKAAKAAQAKARELGTPMSVSVVDDAGRLVLFARGDGTGFFTPETSRAKAVAAAAFRRPTKDMANLRESAPAFWGNIAGGIGRAGSAEHWSCPGYLQGKVDRSRGLWRRHRGAGSSLRRSRSGGNSEQLRLRSIERPGSGRLGLFSRQDAKNAK